MALLSVYAPDRIAYPKQEAGEREWNKIRSNCEELKEKHSDKWKISTQRAIWDFDKQTKAAKGLVGSENKFLAILEHSFDVIYSLNLITKNVEYLRPSSSDKSIATERESDISDLLAPLAPE